MSDMQHTPGPWEVTKTRGGIRCCVVEPSRRMCVADVVACGEGDEQRDADARLIAASPELLAFAKWAVHQFQGDSGTGDSYWSDFSEYNDGLSAIAQATGGAA